MGPVGDFLECGNLHGHVCRFFLTYLLGVLVADNQRI